MTEISAKVRTFMEKVNELMVELNTPDIIHNVGIFVFDIKTKTGQHFGFGCPACMANAIIAAKANGELQHRPESATHNGEFRDDSYSFRGEGEKRIRIDEPGETESNSK